MLVLNISRLRYSLNIWETLTLELTVIDSPLPKKGASLILPSNVTKWHTLLLFKIWSSVKYIWREKLKGSSDFCQKAISPWKKDHHHLINCLYEGVIKSKLHFSQTDRFVVSNAGCFFDLREMDIDRSQSKDDLHSQSVQVLKHARNPIFGNWDHPRNSNAAKYLRENHLFSLPHSSVSGFFEVIFWHHPFHKNCLRLEVSFKGLH